MAYEQFAQARITGEPGRKFQLRGGGVKIGDIPNLPKVDPSMRPANYPDIPAIRHSKMDLGGQDWSRRAGQLQQENLPGSFERGAARMAAAAGDAEFKMGTAISRGSQALSSGLGDLAGSLNKIQAHLDHETTKSMAAKEDNAYDIAKSAFDVRVEKEGIPAANYQKEFWGPGGEGENYRKYVETLKPTNSWSSRTVTDDLESRVAGREAGFTVHANTQLANEIHSSNVEAHKFRFENALKENRFDDARTAMNDARAANTINDGQVERMKSEIKTQEDKWFADAIINTKVDPKLAYESKEKGGKVPGPALAMQEAQKVLDAREGHEKGASDIFPNIDKVEARRILDQASKQFADNEKNDVSSLTRRALAGDATEEQIRKEAKILGFDNQTTDGIVKVVKEARPYDDEKVGEIYKVLTATDFKNPETALAERRKIEQMIFDGADKRSADVLLTELGKKWDKRDKPSTIQEEEVKGANDLITATFEHQITEAKKKKDKSELTSLNKKRMDAYKEVERYKEANPEFDSGKLHEHIVDYLQPERQKESQKAVNAQTTPVDIRPYSGGTTTQAPAGPAYGTPEWYAKQKELAMQKEKPAAAPVPRTQVGGGYVVGEESPAMPEAAVGTSGAPTPFVPRVAPPQPTTAATAAPAPPGQTMSIAATAYVPGMGGKEGKNEVAYRRGPAYTFEQYEKGEVPWVSVAADSNSSLQGKFLKNDAYPGVLFKVEDTGSDFQGKGDTRIDIAFSDKSKAKSFVAAGNNYQVVDEAGAAQIAGGPRGTAPSVTTREAETAGPIKIVSRAGELDLPAMKRPRDTSKIAKIVVHGDVLTDVDKLINIQRNDDRGYHYYIGLDGSVTEAVDPGHIANHIKGANSDSIGIILVGADNGRMPTAAQDNAAKKLISQLAKKYGISQKDVMGHGERQPNRRDVREGGNVARDIREKGFV